MILQFQLEAQENLEYFGFNNTLNLEVLAYSSFYYDEPKNLGKIINNNNFSGVSDSKQLGNEISNMLFSFLKKHSFWKELIKKIKNKVSEKNKSWKFW